MSGRQHKVASGENRSDKASGQARGCTGERQPTLTTPPVVETEFTELPDGALVELIEDPDNSGRSLLAIYEEGEVRIANRFQYGDRVLVPIPRDRHIIRHVRLPRGVEACESASSLVPRIHSIFSQCLDLREEYIFLLTCFVLSTWFIDQLPVAPYVALVGLPRSGKSTALSLLNLFCRRALLTADISTAAFYRVCDLLTPTLLIDETGTAGAQRELLHVLRTGTSRGLVALRKQESFKTFGAKAVSWIELPNDAALNSRCLLIPLHETHRADLKRPWDPTIVQAADGIQKQLLHLRLSNYKKLTIPKIQGDEGLHSRARDLFQSLALPIGGNTSICNRLLNNLQIQQESNREPLTASHSAVLRTLFFFIHTQPGVDSHPVSLLAQHANLLLEAQDEPFRFKPRAIGSALTSLGFSERKRTNFGCVLSLDRNARMRLHELITAYGLHDRVHAGWQEPDTFDHQLWVQTEQAAAQCAWCKNQKEHELHPGKRLR